MKLPKTTRGQFMLILSIAAAARLLGVLTLPLIITNDGSGYLAWGQQLAHGTWPDFPTTRTPGYALFLAAAFRTIGENAHAVLIAQAILGIATSLLAFHTARTIAGSRAGLTAGVVIALEPWLFLFEHYALAETLTLFLVMLSAAAAVSVRQHRLILHAFVAGLAISAAVLARPAMQAWLPFVFLACALGAPNLKRSPRPAIACVAGMVFLMAPWLVYNTNRGTPKIVETDGLALWGGLARSQLLTPDFELPEEGEQLAQDLFQELPPSEAEVLGYYNRIGSIEDFDRSAFLGSWAKESISDNPVGYIKAVGHATLWQSNAMAPGSPYTHDELRWLMRRLGKRDTSEPGSAPNFSASINELIDARFHDKAGVGPQAWLYRKWPIGMTRNLIHPAIGLLALAACAALIKRKQYTPAALILGSFAVVGAHALLLQPFSRYSMTAWAIWWVAAATLLPSKQIQDEQQPTTD